MSALAQCDAFGYIYDQAGDPAPDILVVLKRVLDAGGNPILLGPKTTTTDSAGSFHFTLPELATAFISARASALWNCPEGRAFTVPPGPSGELIPDFSLPSSTLVEPPLVYVGDVLSIPKASATQDGYLAAADFAAFEAGGAEVGVTQINTGAGLTGGPITDTGTIGLQVISGVAGTWTNPTSISINAYGQIVAITATADVTAPVISAISATSITGSGATILWTTDDFSDSQVEYSTDLSYSSSTTLNTTSVTSHSVPITGTAASTLYHYRVKSRNTAGLPTTSGDNTFTTTVADDTTAPIITLGSPTSITAGGVTINWTTDEASDSQVDYSIDMSYGISTAIGNPVPPGTTDHHAILTGLTASTLYHYRVKSKDAAGNPATPVTGTFMTAAPPADLLTGLVSMWKMDESSGARVDSGSSGNNLTATGSVTSGTGKISLGAHFSGAGTDYLSHANNTSLQTGDVDYVIACWVKFDSKPAGESEFVSKTFGDSAQDEFFLGYSGGSDRIRFYVCGGPTPVYTSVVADDLGSPEINTWYFIIAWHDMATGTINIQVNKDAVGAVNTAARLEPLNVSALSPLLFGTYGNPAAPSHFLPGFIDEVAFWKGRILNSAERTALWNGGAGLPFTSWT